MATVHRKSEQLGMSYSTATNKLTRDLLWSYIQHCKHNECYRCGGEMSREDFTIEHVEDWLDSDNPRDIYFDLANIEFSHRSCNSRHTRRRKYTTEEERKLAKRKQDRIRRKKNYNPQKRREKYLRQGT